MRFSLLGMIVALALQIAVAEAKTSLSCAGYPRFTTVFVNNQPETYTQVCRIAQVTAPLSDSIAVSTIAGSVSSHGGATAAIPVYARIIAQASTNGAATTLANRVVIATASGAIFAKPASAKYPRALVIDFETFAPATTNVMEKTKAGDVAADGYDATLTVTTMAGAISLRNIDGAVTATTGAGNITINLSSTGWTGQGLAATASAGSIRLSRPSGYVARITAKTDAGTVSIDGKVTSGPGPISVTTGIGQPIGLTTGAGDVIVR